MLTCQTLHERKPLVLHPGVRNYASELQLALGPWGRSLEGVDVRLFLLSFWTSASWASLSVLVFSLLLVFS